jgi:hypothetical protein
MNWWWLVALAAVLVLLGIYLSMTAGRLDRLHLRIESAERALEAQLALRTAITIDLAASGLVDPVLSAVLTDAAHAARTSAPAGARAREIAESDLSRILSAAFQDPEDVLELKRDPEGAVFLEELAATCRRVELSRRFLNDAVRACRQVRSLRMARWFHLAGHTSWPQTVEMDDTPPPLLSAS